METKPNISVDVPPNSPISSLLQEVFTNTTASNWKYSLPPCDKIQHIKQLIIKFHTCKDFVQSNNLWELGEDLYIIRLDNLYPNICITKRTLQHAVHLNISQIPLIPYVTSSLSELDKEALCITAMFTQFPDVAPFIFELQINENIRYTSSHRAHNSQCKIIDLFLQNAHLMPKSTRKTLITHLEVLNGQEPKADTSSTESPVKVLIFIFLHRLPMFTNHFSYQLT